MNHKIYLVMGYDVSKTTDFANVNILGCFDNEINAKNAQMNLSGGKIKRSFEGSKAFYGENKMCTWINELNINEYCKLNARQPN